MPRQAWLFLLEGEERAVLERLRSLEGGELRVVEGRYVRGKAAGFPGVPATLESRSAQPGERRLYVFHAEHSRSLVAHAQPQGPYAGWSLVDEERSDALVLVLPARRGLDVLPARLEAHLHVWRGDAKTRKHPPFITWAARLIRDTLRTYPRTGVPWLRATPGALAAARAGTARLSYLYRPIPIGGDP